MIVPYLLRLFCLCLAAFFVVHSVVGLAVGAAGSAAVRAAGHMRPRAAGRFLLTLRLLPAALALFVVIGLCVPSYLWLEPETNTEELGSGCLAAAFLAAGLWTMSAVRVARAAVQSARHGRGFRRLRRSTSRSNSRLPIWILDTPAPLLALVGVLRSRIVVSRPVMHALSAGQLAAALRHEEAHQASHDNLKRLLLLLAPGLLPGVRGFHAIERGWARFTEWAADDDAVAGNPHLSVSLASALVRIARMGGVPLPSPLATSFLADSSEISVRGNRLLNPLPAPPVRRNSAAMAIRAALAALTVGCTVSMLHPATLESAHRIIEQLIH